MKLIRWVVVAALLSAQTDYVFAEDQTDELKKLKQQLQELDQKVRILERNKELETEAAEAKTKTLPAINLGANGLTLQSADTNFALAFHGVLQVDNRTFFHDGGINGNENNHNLHSVNSV